MCSTSNKRNTLVWGNGLLRCSCETHLIAGVPVLPGSAICHAGKHHRAYVDNMNKQIAGTELENKSLEEIVLASWNNGNPTPVFNNAAQVRATRLWGGCCCQGELLIGGLRAFLLYIACGPTVWHVCRMFLWAKVLASPAAARRCLACDCACVWHVLQVWNHTFFWESIKPSGGGAPSGKLAEAINSSFGSLDKFKDQFKAAGVQPCMRPAHICFLTMHVLGCFDTKQLSQQPSCLGVLHVVQQAWHFSTDAFRYPGWLSGTIRAISQQNALVGATTQAGQN